MSASRSRLLQHYPAETERRALLALVVLVTVALYYALYVGSGVTPLVMRDLRMPFEYLVSALALGNAVGAFASLLAGLSDRFGRVRLVLWGLLLVALLTGIAAPAVQTRFQYAALGIAIGFVEGIILVATPALIRDFSPQVGRATAMGFWTIGPVLGSLLTSAVNSATLEILPGWRPQFIICGAFCAAVFLLAWLFLRELAPALRDQLMVNDRDRGINEQRARSGIAPDLSRPWQQMLRFDVLASALGVSLLLLVYYTAVAFGVIYLVTVFGFSPARANALLNWSWAANAAALIAAGLWSDRLRVRKPFMLAGGAGSAAMIWIFLGHGGGHPSFAIMALIAAILSILMGAAYATWMASFTETVEARNPALTATGLAIWGWLLRLVVTASFLAIPHVIDTVTVLVGAPPVLAAWRQVQAAGGTPSPELLARYAAVAHAAHDTAAQWQDWYSLCALGAVAFIVLTFGMKGRWSPAAARRDEAAHDAAAARELAA